MRLDIETALYFRDQFREARNTALQDAEGFQKILFALERLGCYLSGSIHTLSAYKDCIQELARTSPLAEEIPQKHRSWHIPFSELYDLVREARNDALHQGAFARHLTYNAVQLAFVLEDALMDDLNHAGAYMVREPICAALWQPLSFVRQQMLANSFTYLPVWNSSRWMLVSDYHVAQYLRKGDRKKRLAERLQDAIDKGLTLEVASTCFDDDTVSDVLEKSEGKPVLVIEREHTERLLGIITSFDLL
jgi:hypothetical protein